MEKSKARRIIPHRDDLTADHPWFPTIESIFWGVFVIVLNFSVHKLLHQNFELYLAGLTRHMKSAPKGFGCNLSSRPRAFVFGLHTAGKRIRIDLHVQPSIRFHDMTRYFLNKPQ